MATFAYSKPDKAAKTDEVTTVGVAVLGSRELWDVITSFMTGFPLAVHEFYSESDPMMLQRVYEGWGRDRYLFGSLTGRGLLLHLAIAANDSEMLTRLFKLASYPQYKRDRRLSCKKAMRCAVLLNRVELLATIDTLRRSEDLNWTWEPNLMRIALQHEDPDLRVLDWLVARLPLKTNRLYERDMIFHTTQGNLAVVRWLHEHKLKIPKRALERAVKGGHGDMLRYFYEHSAKRCDSTVLDLAANAGDVAIVRLIIENQTKDVSQDAIYWAVVYGQLDVVKYLVASKIQERSHPYMIERAAAYGFFDVIKYLHEADIGEFTAHVMHEAAAHGQLEIVQFLHANRTEGCCPDTLDRAARNGHLEVVKFLHRHCTLECTTDGFDRAASNGHLGVIQFLYQERGERCSANATTWAAERGHYDVVKFLCEKNLDAEIACALKSAASKCHLEIVQLLHSRLQPGESAYEAVEVSVRQRSIVQFLCEHQEREPVRFLQQAVNQSSAKVVHAVWQYASLEEVIEAKTSAACENKREIATRLEKCVWIKMRQAASASAKK